MTHPSPTPAADARPILIVPYMWIGDFVRCHSVVKVLKARWPQRPVDMLATVGPLKTAFFDKTAKPGTQYFYKVVAANRIGVGPTCGELAEVPRPRRPARV